ncbi:MAG TPA: hypothetical protein VE890_04040, partial [Thermoguttaceae bacterium]|nr:hypothetical protein [Thermoguttaceae bacterium]
KARWTPFSSLRGFALTGGYEYRSIARENVTYMFNENGGAPVDGELGFRQHTTVSNILHFGTEMKVTRSLDSFVRYKMTQTNDPIFGFSESLEDGAVPPRAVASSFGQSLNTNQPEHEDLVEFGGSWTPSYNFMLSGSIGIQKRHHSSPAANYDEDDYPMVFTAWYAPTDRWSITGGLGFFSNWIGQDVTIGKNHEGHGTVEDIYDTRFDYGGRAEVINLGSTYAATNRLTLTGTFEHTRSFNGFADPSVAAIGGGLDGVSLISTPGLSDVRVQTTRFSAGFDYELREQVSTYFRYSYYNYNDKAGNGNSGTASFFLGGLTATY